MKKIFQTPTSLASFFLLVLMTFHSSVCLAQEKLSEVSKITKPSEIPKNYVQRVSSDRTPITNLVQSRSDLPQFLQKYTQEKSSLLLQSKVQVPAPNRPVQKILEGFLLLEESNLQTSRIEAVSCNDSPIGTNDLYVTSNDRSLTIDAPGFLTNDNDLAGELLTASSIVEGVENGSLSALTNGSFSYIPTPGFIGTDQFQYLMQNASGFSSDPVTVTIEVREAGNRVPVGSDDSYGALAGTILTVAAPGFLANDIDQDGDVLTANSITQPVANGALSALTNGSFSYTPNPGFTGTDQFQYKMQDSESNSSEPITVSIQVYEGNRKPVGTDDIFGIVVNSTLIIPAPGFMINDIDPDGDAFTATSIVDGVDHGSLSALTSGSFSYTPTSGFVGTDQFQYNIQDATGNSSEPITVILKVVDTGLLPIGFDDSYKTADGSILNIAAPGFLLNDIDQNGEVLIANSISDGVDHGTLSALTDGAFIYTPTPGFTGTDQFQYLMQDASGNLSDPVTVTIEVSETYNRIPVGIDDSYGALAGMTLTLSSPGFLANDIDQDGEVLTANSISDGVDNGSLSALTDGSFSYTPNAGFTGTDQFQYIMQDASGNSSEPVTVTIEVMEGNRNPMGTNDVYTVVKNTALNIAEAGFLTNDFDADGDALIASSISVGVDHGTLSALTNGSFTYTPASGFIGTDQFQYIMQDASSNQSEPVTVIFEVVGPNEPPVASAMNITTECTGPAGTIVTLDGSNSTDPEGGVLTYTWFENSSIIAGPSTSSTSDFTFSTGIHQVKLMVEDECGQSSETDITVTIEDSTGPLVEAAFSPTGKADEFMISCTSSDVCAEVVDSSSLIIIPDLTNPSVSLKNKKVYSLDIDVEKNTVSVEAPDAAAFWAMVLANGGVEVDDGQVIDAKYEKNKYQFRFDANGKLLSVKGNMVTLQCTATDGNGNSSMSEASLPLDGVLPLSETSNLAIQHQNYPNPFSGTTTIRYNLPQQAFVQISIFDAVGRVVDVFAGEEMEAGEHAVTWDATGQNAGVYIYHIQYNNRLVTNKMILIWR